MKRFLVLLPLLALALAGCERETTFGLSSANDYAYAVGTPADALGVVQRFEAAANCLGTSGLLTERPLASSSSPSSRAVRFQGERVDAELSLVLPQQGFATISFVYRYETGDAKLRDAATRLLTQLRAVLTPWHPIPDDRVPGLRNQPAPSAGA